MPFTKTASVCTIAVATFDGNKLKKTAASDDGQSSYLSGNRSIDIKAALDIVAGEYDISSDPNDYFFEAIRGNTVNVPNENDDGFHKNELLRFDHRLAKQVYRTYELKPHHVSHRADNPKAARGFIVDAHYNDSKPSLDVCPNENCGNHTAERENRDETGIHCKKCGQVVKDEFIELLIAIDRKKDPTFAQGVESGVLKHGSMGCSCLRTRCNVCNHIAYSRAEFCAHIRNKGKDYDDSEPGFKPVAFVVKYPKGKAAGKPRKVARAHEWCEGTVFDEYSRVHDPADPKAEQYEILQLKAKVASMQSEPDEKLRNQFESEILIMQTKLADLERKVNDKIMSKAAQKDGDVNINIDPNSTGSEGVKIDSDEPLEQDLDAATPIEEMTPESVGATPSESGEEITPEAMGVMPPAPGTPSQPPIPPAPKRGASVEGKSLLNTLKNLGGPSMLRFANSYKHLKAEITSAGNVRVFDDKGTMFVVKPDRLQNDRKTASKEGAELAKEVLTMIAEYGIGHTIKATNAIVGPRTAQVLEYAVDDMKDMDRGEPGSVIEDAGTDMGADRGTPEESATAKPQTVDRKEAPETKSVKDSTIPDRKTDHEDENNDVKPGDLSSVKDPDSDTREKREQKDLKDSTLDSDVNDNEMKRKSETERSLEHKHRAHAARLEALYNKRYEQKVAELEKIIFLTVLYVL